ncbi:hypothetical protein RHS01_06632 [Rhizoctonia solani]|uniref:NEDD8-activating enzyme E1 catalytic subunit n=1 Tax=Rhizoctonia solani TaxID=456999 RepID=A0A8H7M5Z5_9AGAM|nr:hypothetical protein RHS01_06632 [Rhizoctonia solani]
MSTAALDSNSQWDGRWSHVDQLLDRPGPRTDEAFAPDAAKEFLRDKCKVLVIGAGGLGCEILPNLALLGFKDIHVIDMDTIDVSNLNRQFLFRPKDVGRPKAVVAAEYVMNRVPGVNVTPYYGKIQDKDDDYYMQFTLVICGLDSVEARRWINATLVNLVDNDNPESLKPLIDGGTEGFKGQARVIFPTVTSCYECSLDMLNKPTAFPICTIANTPRLPEHCIEWASVLEWPRVHGDKKMDTDDPEHIGWLYQTASARAKEFKIDGVTWSLTQGVVKNIIPAIASTNAIIAGTEGVYSYTFEHEQRKDCPVCGGEVLDVAVSSEWTVERFIEWLQEKQDVQIKKPSLSSGGKNIYLQAPPQLEQATRPNLEKKLSELVNALNIAPSATVSHNIDDEMDLVFEFAPPNECLCLDVLGTRVVFATTMTVPSSSSHSVHEEVVHASNGHEERNVPNETTALISPSPRTASRRTDKRRQEIPERRSFYDFWGVKILFISISLLAAISVVALVLLILNTGISSIAQFLPPHRGSRLLPVWFALISAWISLSAVTLFGTPSALTRVSLIASLVLLLLDIILLAAVKQLRRQESALTLIACGVAIISTATSLGANYVVKNLRDKEGIPIRHGAETVREAELRARLYVAQENYWSNRAARAIKVILSFILTFVTSLVLFLITFDICLTAIDSSVVPPFERSRFHSVQPDPAHWSFKIYLTQPPVDEGRFATFQRSIRVYEGSSRSLGGDWVVNLREVGRVGRVCVWDRPGYGFSDNGPSAEMGHVSNALWQALQHEGEEGPYAAHPLFASRHPKDVHSLLYIDSETSHTYFLTRARHNTFFHTHLPVLIAPLGLSRIASLVKNHTPRSGRVLANTLQHTEWQNPRLLSTLLQEQYLTHSRQSASFRDLLESERQYPARRPTIVLSSGERVSKESAWRDAQKRLWQEIVDEKGRVRWEILEGVGHDICAKTSEGAVGTGLEACEKAVEDLVWRD